MAPTDSPNPFQDRTRLPAKLVFDTAGRTLATGTRRRESSSRHVLYEVEDFCLDLRLETSPQSAAMIVVGQLADRQDPLAPLAGLSVFVMAEDTLVARTTSNRQGEFQLSIDSASEAEQGERPSSTLDNRGLKTFQDLMSLCLPFGDEEFVEVPLYP